MPGDVSSSYRGPVTPLRKIVARFINEHGAECERLECGHVIHRKEDHYGPTNAARRRCQKCWLEASDAHLRAANEGETD